MIPYRHQSQNRIKNKKKANLLLLKKKKLNIGNEVLREIFQ